MAVKDWIPVAQDIYDALVEDGNTNQGKTLKISYKDLCEILDKHNIAVTESMNRLVSKIEASIVYIIRREVQCKDLSKSLHENGLFINDLTDDEERSAYSSYNIPRSLWTYQIAHRLKLAFGDPKAKEEAIKDDEENIIEDKIEVSEAKENSNEDKDFEDALKYLYSIKKSNPSKFIDCGSELIKAFVIGNVIDNESEYIFVEGKSVTQLLDIINAANFDIKDKDQVDTCKSLLYTIKQTVLLNKSDNNNFSGFMMAMMANMESVENTSDSSPISQKSPTIQEIDQKIYKKAAAFDKLVEALRPIFNELTN